MIKGVGLFIFLSVFLIGFISAGLVAEYNFENGASDSVGSNDGTFYDNANVVDNSVRGKVASFDGDEDWLEIPKVLDITVDTTWGISMWFNLNSLPSVTGDSLLFRYSGSRSTSDAYFYVDDTGNAIKSYDGSKGMAKYVYAGTWYHVVGVRDGLRNFKIYVNGVLKDSRTDFDFDSTGSSFSIFQDDGRNNWGEGLVDDIKIYDHALTASEVGGLFSGDVGVAVDVPATCVATTTCSNQGKVCGSFTNDCGESVSCGACSSGSSCSAAGLCIAEAVVDQPSSGGICNGCLVGNSCLRQGIRFLSVGSSSYCSIMEEITLQRDSGLVCENSFECISNHCSKGICVDLLGEIKSQTSLLKQILCKITHTSEVEYQACLIE